MVQSSARQRDGEDHLRPGGRRDAGRSGRPRAGVGATGSRLGRRTFLRTAAGAAATAAAAGAAVAQDAPYGGWFGDVDNYDGTVDRRGRSEVTVEVGAQGNGGPFAFEPPAVRVDPGTAVTFEWVSDTHNVVPESQPGGAGWEGNDTIENSGYSFASTFETEGVYTYFCRPHRAMGMKGAVVVGDERVGEGPVGPPGEGGADDGGGGAPAFTVPSTPVLVGTGLVLVGLAPVALAAAWLFRGRGGPVDPATPEAAGAREAADAPAAAGPVETESRALAAVEREIDHESFDPTGTLVLVVVYFAVLVVMWVFMYFVEFLGGGPTVVG